MPSKSCKSKVPLHFRNTPAIVSIPQLELQDSTGTTTVTRIQWHLKVTHRTYVVRVADWPDRVTDKVILPPKCMQCLQDAVDPPSHQLPSGVFFLKMSVG